jgi:hypothetical protein
MDPGDRTGDVGMEMGQERLDPEEIPGPIAIWEICVNNCESLNEAIAFAKVLTLEPTPFPSGTLREQGAGYSTRRRYSLKNQRRR